MESCVLFFQRSTACSKQLTPSTAEIVTFLLAVNNRGVYYVNGLGGGEGEGCRLATFSKEVFVRLRGLCFTHGRENQKLTERKDDKPSA